MKKPLLLAAISLLLPSVAFAALPQRSIGRQPKAALPALERTVAQKSLHRSPATQAADAITVPFVHSLGKNESTIMATYTVIDANGDGRTWKPGGFTAYSVCMAPNSEDVEAADDWLVSPPVQLQAGKYYTLSFEEDMTLKKTEDKLAVYFGTECAAEALTNVVVPEHAILYNDKVFVKKEKQFAVPADGLYYFGFHCTSERTKSGTPKLCNFAIEECEAPIIVPDNAIEVPFTHSLGKNEKETTDLYTVIDADGDTRTWKPGGFTGYSVCMKPTADEVAANDDWLISVPVHLLAGTNYTASFEEGRALTSGQEDIVGLYIGLDKTAEAMTQAVIAPHAVTIKDFNETSASFTVAKEGYYYFGLHCTSEKTKSGNLKVCNLKVVESAEIVEPAAAGTIAVTPAPKGELKATITYTAPTLTASGAPLSSISKVVITTNWAFKTELTDVVPGGTYTVETTDVYNNGYNRFEGVAFVGETAGEPALLTDVFLGPDNPLPPTGLTIALADDYRHVTISWDAVGEVGERGGYVNPSKAVYYIFDAFGSYIDPALAQTSATSFTFDYSDFAGQDFVAYQVTAGIDETYYSEAATSDIVIIGDPEPLPFYESFADASYAQAWAIDLESQGNTYCGVLYDNELQTNADAEPGVEPEFLNSHDADNGFFYFMPIDKDSSYGFFSTKIDISKAANPVYEFFYQGKGSVIDAKVGVDGAPMQVVHSIDMKENPTDGWTLARIDLSPYRSSRYITVGVLFRAIHNDDEHIWSVPFDNMRVIDLADKALRFSAVSIPETVKAGDDIKVDVAVENIGRLDLSGAALELLTDGEVAATFTFDALAPASVANATLSLPTDMLSADKIAIELRAKADGATDLPKASGDVSLQFPAYPAPQALAASVNSGVVEITWEAPDFIELTKPVARTEDFESPDYLLWTYESFGGFSFIDGDKGRTYTFLGDVNNPYRTYPMAFQLFNPSLSGMAPDAVAMDAPTHSGEQMLVAWSTNGPNDNWLISPELSGDAQTVTFWARSFTAGFAETFEIYVSDSPELTSFEQVETVENYTGTVPEQWTLYSFAVPAGKKYFALLHTSVDTYALFLDDFTFECGGTLPADTELTGYKVFCDNEPLSDAAVIATATSATHTPAVSGTYTYRVSAVYSGGESRACPAVEIDVTVDGLTGPGGATSIACKDRILTVKAAPSTPVDVFTPDGRTVVRGAATAAGEFTAELPAGICIVDVAGTVRKFIIE